MLIIFQILQSSSFGRHFGVSVAVHIDISWPLRLKFKIDSKGGVFPNCDDHSTQDMQSIWQL